MRPSRRSGSALKSRRSNTPRRSPSVAKPTAVPSSVKATGKPSISSTKDPRRTSRGRGLAGPSSPQGDGRLSSVLRLRRRLASACSATKPAKVRSWVFSRKYPGVKVSANCSECAPGVQHDRDRGPRNDDEPRPRERAECRRPRWAARGARSPCADGRCPRATWASQRMA